MKRFFYGNYAIDIFAQGRLTPNTVAVQYYATVTRPGEKVKADTPKTPLQDSKEAALVSGMKLARIIASNG